MKTKFSLGCIVTVTSLVIACNGVDIQPEPSSTSSSSPSESVASSSNASSGNGGTGGAHMGAGGSGGMSCDPCGNKNGTRIVAQLLQTNADDGLHWEEKIGWYDLQLKTKCKAIVAEDGVIRCLPPEGTAIKLTMQQAAMPLFSEGSCTQRVIPGSQPICGSDTKYAIEPVGTPLTCKGQPYRVYALGTYAAGLPMIYTKNGAGQCVTGSNPGGVYIVDSTLSPASFVAMTETISP